MQDLTVSLTNRFRRNLIDEIHKKTKTIDTYETVVATEHAVIKKCETNISVL